MVKAVIEKFYAVIQPSKDFDPMRFLSTVLTFSNLSTGLATILLVAVSFVIVRGLEQRQADVKTPGTFLPLAVVEIEAWFDRRVRRLNAVSVLVTLFLVAGLTQMDRWMAWPAALMSKKDLFPEGTSSNYSLVENSVLLAHAIWFSALIAAVIFPAHWILAHKCRHLAREALGAEPDAAAKLIDKTRVEVDLKGYLERYRGVVLVLMPPIAQQVLELLK